jgi:hypothetical protein
MRSRVTKWGSPDDALQVGEADEIAVEGDVAGEEVPF